MLFVNALDYFALLKLQFNDICEVLIKQTFLDKKVLVHWLKLACTLYEVSQAYQFGWFIQAHNGLGV